MFFFFFSTFFFFFSAHFTLLSSPYPYTRARATRKFTHNPLYYDSRRFGQFRYPTCDNSGVGKIFDVDGGTRFFFFNAIYFPCYTQSNYYCCRKQCALVFVESMEKKLPYRTRRLCEPTAYVTIIIIIINNTNVVRVRVEKRPPSMKRKSE